MSVLFTPLAAPLAPTSRGDSFPVRRIFCVGRNYAAHAREMGGNPDREPPFFFTKWGEAVVFDGATIAYPRATQHYHHEVELVVAIGGSGRDVPASEALSLVYGYACGLDMTRRDLQDKAKEARKPWSSSKNFEESAPLGVIHPAADVGHLDKGRIELRVNGEVRQSGDLADMVWPVADVVALASRLWGLEPGDLIYTGTPEGVGAVQPGDSLVVSIDGLTPLRLNVAGAGA